MKRRHFLRNSLSTLPVLVNGLPLFSMANDRPFGKTLEETNKVLVIVQLIGGNDGLNTLIPIDQYSNLSRARNEILVPENKVLKIADGVGLHPVLSGMRDVFESGKMTILQGVGYPNPNQSHFRSTDIWTSGSSSADYISTGWAGRFFDHNYPGFPEGYPNENESDPIAIAVGNSVSETCQGMVSNFSMALKDPFSLYPLTENEPGDTPDNYYGKELAAVRDAILKTNAYADRITLAAEKGNTLSSLYPDGNKLAAALRNVALLISGGLQTKVYVISLGGFDTHANQIDIGDTTQGNHANLLKTLSEAITAFQDDLQKLNLEERVLGMTFSEFGRRIAANGSYGTDHGTGAPLFIFGSCVQSGILGTNPEIPSEVGKKDGVAMQYDFRDIYGSILEKWFETERSVVESVLHPDYAVLPIIQGCQTTSAPDFEAQNIILQISATPNPFHTKTNLTFQGRGERMTITLFDHMGYEVIRLADKHFPTGEHHIPLSGNALPPGNYFVRIVSSTSNGVKSIVKI